LLGWDVETAYEAGLSGKVDDVQLLIYAREHNRILLTFDTLKARHGEQIARELRINGGRIVQVRGGAQQEKHRIVGKILFHYQDWQQFLASGDGISIVSDLRPCRNLNPEEYHHQYHRIDAEQFEKYLEHKRKSLLKPIKRRRKRKPPPEEQQSLN
jgi:hypothetical protein